MSTGKGKKIKIAVAVVCLLVCLSVPVGVWLWYSDNALAVTEYEYTDALLPSAFDGLRIVQVSDLHNKSFGKGNEKLLEAVRGCEPELIFITGDVFDGNRFSEKTAENIDSQPASVFLREAVKIAPVYYVAGNHECRIDFEFFDVSGYIASLGVRVLDSETDSIERDGSRLNIIGIYETGYFTHRQNPWFFEIEKARDRKPFVDEVNEQAEAGFKDELLSLDDAQGYNILLLHRPDYDELLGESDIDLCFSGHAHGGQIVLFGKYPLYAPNQGFFPELTSGVHECGNTALVISRGLGNSRFPFRIGNPPEVVLMVLTCG